MLVEPDLAALGLLGAVCDERRPRRGRDGVTALAGRDAPELRGGAVRLGRRRPVARLGQQRAARGDPVQVRRRVQLEGEGARARRQRAPRARGRDGHSGVEGGRDAVGAVVDGAGQSLYFVFSFKSYLALHFVFDFL